MVERHFVVSSKTIKYEGVFSASGVYGVIQDWASDKGYFPIEADHTESVKPEGKFVDVLLYPTLKKLSDYAKGVFRIHIQMSGLNDIAIERDGRKVKLQEGKVVIRMQGFLETDYEQRWETKPLLYVLRTLFEKYVYGPFISGYESAIKEDYAVLESRLKSYFNLEKFKR